MGRGSIIFPALKFFIFFYIPRMAEQNCLQFCGVVFERQGWPQTKKTGDQVTKHCGFSVHFKARVAFADDNASAANPGASLTVVDAGHFALALVVIGAVDAHHRLTRGKVCQENHLRHCPPPFVYVGNVDDSRAVVKGVMYIITKGMHFNSQMRQIP